MLHKNVIEKTNGFRELTDAELEAVSGGNEYQGHIIVTAPPWNDPEYLAQQWGTPMYGNYTSNIWYQNAMHYSQMYGDGGATSHVDDICSLEAAEERTDFLSTLIEAQIKAQPDWNEREYGALIYYDTNGLLKMGPLTRGMTVAEAAAAGLPAPETRFSIPSDLGPGGIVAAVHNHPDIGYNNSQDLDNHYPSYNGTTADSDYRTFEGLVGVDGRFASVNGFAMYVLGPDGVLREFDLNEGRLSPATDSDPNSRDDLYNPNPTCPDGGQP